MVDDRKHQHARRVRSALPRKFSGSRIDGRLIDKLDEEAEREKRSRDAQLEWILEERYGRLPDLEEAQGDGSVEG